MSAIEALTEFADKDTINEVYEEIFEREHSAHVNGLIEALNLIQKFFNADSNNCDLQTLSNLRAEINLAIDRVNNEKYNSSKVFDGYEE